MILADLNIRLYRIQSTHIAGIAVSLNTRAVFFVVKYLRLITEHLHILIRIVSQKNLRFIILFIALPILNKKLRIVFAASYLMVWYMIISAYLSQFVILYLNIAAPENLNIQTKFFQYLIAILIRIRRSYNIKPFTNNIINLS